MAAIVEERAVKSKDRVKAYGEVFTPRNMVDHMLDLVSEELESGPDFVDKTFLEPSAGDGNFLVRILQRKLAAIGTRLPAEQWRQESLFALASIYGIELLEDNHAEAKAAMLEVFVEWHAGLGGAAGVGTDLGRAAAFLIDTNIIRGNTLTGLTPAGEEIQFSWWHRGSDNLVTREPFTFSSLRGGGGMFDFTVYESYAPCAIDEVHQEARA